MSTALRHRQTEPVTIETFDAFVEGHTDPRLFELVDGVIVMMSNPTERHEQIVANIAAPLKLAADARGCRTYSGGIRLQRSDDRTDVDKPKPDITVRCGPVTTRAYVTDPIIVIEVLSPSTIDYDRGPKLTLYKSFSTMMHIVLVYQDQMRVEHYRRTENGLELEVLKQAGDVLRLEAVEFSLDLDRVYFDVPF